MFYREAGEGPALVLLHGGTRTSSDWLDELPALARHFHVLAPDSRGHGRTDNPHGTLSYSMMADDVASFILALGLESRWSWVIATVARSPSSSGSSTLPFLEPW